MNAQMKRTAIAVAAISLAITCYDPAHGATKRAVKKMQSIDAQPTIKAGDFKPAGHQYDVDFGTFKIHLDFKSDRLLSFADMQGKPVAVKIHPVKLRENLYLVTWEEKDGSKVVHVEDFENKLIYTNVARPDGTFLRLTGKVIQTR